MVEAAAVTLREAIEAILVIFIMLVYLEKTGEIRKKKFVYAGAIGAVILSVAFAFVFRLVGVNPENEILEGTLFFLSALLVASLVVWMWRHARFIEQEIEMRMGKATSNFALASIAFVMVFREGIETVLFLQSLVLAGSNPVQNFLGGLLGITLAIVFGAVFLRGTVRINLSRFFKVTCAILVVLVLKLVAGGLHEFFEVGLLPSTEGVLEIVGFLTRNSTGAAIIALMLGTLILLVIYDVAKAREPDLSGLKSAERRKVRYQLLKEKYSKMALAFGLMVVIGMILVPTITAAHVTILPPAAVTAENGILRVRVPEGDGIHKFQFEDARFLLAVKGGKARVAIDGCYICPAKGYGVQKGTLVCLNCGAPIEVETLGITGGCNPRALDFRAQDGFVIIDASELKEAWSGSR